MKDWLTLKRNKGFIISFVAVPLVFCSLFCWLQSLALEGTRVGSLIENEDGVPSENMWYTKNFGSTAVGSFMDPPRPWLTL